MKLYLLWILSTKMTNINKTDKYNSKKCNKNYHIKKVNLIAIDNYHYLLLLSKAYVKTKRY